MCKGRLAAFGLALLLALVYFYPVARVVWSPGQVRGLAVVQGDRPLDVQFLTGGRWVSADIPCASGLLFDFSPREAWR